jgi:hypothetical protein
VSFSGLLNCVSQPPGFHVRTSIYAAETDCGFRNSSRLARNFPNLLPGSLEHVALFELEVFHL